MFILMFLSHHILWSWDEMSITWHVTWSCDEIYQNLFDAFPPMNYSQLINWLWMNTKHLQNTDWFISITNVCMSAQIRFLIRLYVYMYCSSWCSYVYLCATVLTIGVFVYKCLYECLLLPCMIFTWAQVKKIIHNSSNYSAVGTSSL